MRTRKFFAFLLVGLLFAGTAAACSSDDDSDSGNTTETTAADSGSTDTTAASGDASSNPDVEEFCQQAEELGQQLQDAINDPTSADAAEITQQASELSASAAQLTSANPDDVDRINECAQALSVTP